MTVGSDANRLKLRLRSIVWHTPLVNAYELVSADGQALPPFSPGAHISVSLPSATRSYSLLNPPTESDHYVLGIARDERSRGGSKHIHEKWKVGDIVHASTPQNLFALDPSPAAVLIAGGIGITPILSMASQLAARGDNWRLYYAVRSKAHAAFQDMLRQWPSNVHFHYDDVDGGVLQLDRIVDEAPPGTHFYCCGPAPMISAFERACAALPPTHVHLERFSAAPAEGLLDGEFEVTLARAGSTIRVEKGVTILEALSAAGVNVASSCGQGVCGVCETRVLAGVPEHRDSVLSATEKAANNTMLICCSRALTPSITLDL